MTASLADNEIWHVMIADDMKRMNVDQLDDAFRLSVVDGSTLVWKTGMATWRRLGSVAGIEDDDDIEIIDDDDDELEDSITRLVAVPLPAPRFATRPVPKPPSPRALSAAPRAVPAAPPAILAAPRAVSTAPSPRTAPPPPAPPPPRSAPPPRMSTPPRTAPPPPLAPPAPRVSSRVAPQAFHTAAPAPFQQRLVAPVYTPPVAAPDPFMLPKRRVAIPSEVDFRRKSGGVRWGRWLVALLLLTGGVLGAYRQNLLREGARRVGLENKYLHGEQRVTAFVSAKAPGALKLALTKLALLPGPNAVPAPASVPARSPVPAAAPASPAPEAARTTEPAQVAAPTPAAKAEAKPSGDPDVKTVSLDSLPVLSTEAAAARPVAAAAPVVAPPAPRPKQPSTRSEPKPKKAAARPAPVEKPAPVAKAEPKAKPAPPPPSSANDSPLKAAIRSAIAADSAKK